MQVFTPYVDPGNTVVGVIRKLFSNRRGRGKLLKMLVRILPRFNSSSLVFKGVNLALDLRNDAEIGLFYDGCIRHEAFYQEVLTTLINTNSVFYDIGCNVGYYSFLFAPYVKNVYAFDANPVLAERAKMNLEASNVKNVLCFNHGLSNTTSYQTFYYNQSSHDVGSFIKSTDTNKSAMVLVTTLDSLITENAMSKPTILKIDVEGLELEILEGYTLLIHHKPIMFLEWNYNEDMAAHKFMRLRNIVDRDYIIYAISRREKLVPVSRGYIKPHEASDLLLIPQAHAQTSQIAHWITT